MIKQYGQKKGNEVYYSWLNKHGYDDSKPLKGQQSKASADSTDSLLDLMDDTGIDDSMLEDTVSDGTEFDSEEKPLHDGLNRREKETKVPATLQQGPPAMADDHTKSLDYKKEEPKLDEQEGVKGEAQPPPEQTTDEPPQPWNRPPTGGDQPDPEPKPMGLGAAGQGFTYNIPSYKFRYHAEPKFEGKDGPIIIKALVLEEGHNVNGWRVPKSEFNRVAEAYKAGRQLRVNHSKDVQDVIGKSFEGKVMKGSDVGLYLGQDKIEGIDPEGMYVAAEFEANPADQQIRTNILHGYVETGSIGLDANAFCEECSKPLKIDPDGEVQRTCRHLDAKIKLQDVDVKEYSYVAEPAFEHTKAFPSFSAAVNSLFEKSSLSDSNTNQSQMSATTEKDKVALEAKAAAKKADAEGEGDADAEALAAKYISFYERGLKQAAKFRADKEPDSDDQTAAKAESESDSDADASVKAESESDADSEADAGKGFAPTRAGASRKTTQQSRQAPSKTEKATGDDLLSRVLAPSAYQAAKNPDLIELMKKIADPAITGGKVPLGLKASIERRVQSGRFD